MKSRKVNSLIAVSGPPCSGKSTLAAALAARLGAVHLEVDRIRTAIIPHTDCSEADRDIGYRAMHLTAEYLLRCGRAVILDATYNRAGRRADLNELSSRTYARLVLVHCKVSSGVAVERFKNRVTPHFAVDLDEVRVRELAENYDYSASALSLDAAQPLDTSIELIIRHLHA